MQQGEDKFYFCIRNKTTKKILDSDMYGLLIFEYEKQAYNYIERNNLSKNIYKVETFKRRKR